MVNFEEDDEEEWGHALSAACCLQNVAKLLKNSVLDKEVQFFGQYLEHENWKN